MRAAGLIAGLAAALTTSGCIAVSAVRVAGDVAEGVVRTTGVVAEAGVDAVTPGDDEEEDEDRR